MTAACASRSRRPVHCDPVDALRHVVHPARQGDVQAAASVVAGPRPRRRR